MKGNVFARAKLGSLDLRNRIIRAGCFEGMCHGGSVTDALIEHHRALSAGGIAMTTVGYCDIVPRKWLGRVMAFLVMLIGIGFFGWAIAQFSAAITLQKLRSDITDHRDLRNKIVATVEGTTSIDALDDLGAIVVPVRVIDDAIERLLQHQVDAVVFDSPTILYYARNVAPGKVTVVGNLFDIQYYGFLFPQGSELREPVNRALLKMHTTGQYDKIFKKSPHLGENR